jgi:hypothetical protein
MSHFQAFHSQKLKFKLPLSLHLHKKQDEGGKFSLMACKFSQTSPSKIWELVRLYILTNFDSVFECATREIWWIPPKCKCALSEAILEGQ